MSSTAPPVQPPGFWRTALTPRMLGLLALFLVVAAVCARLGVWQLDRAVERGERNAAVRSAEQSMAPAVPIDDVLAPRESFRGDLIGEKVEVVGTFEGETLLVPGRVNAGRTGFLVLDALRTDAGLLPVVRGWVAAPAAPAPPSGEVRLEGRLQAGEAAEPADLPDGQINGIAPGELVNLWGGPLYTGYLVVSEPGQDGVEALPPPTTPGGGLDLQNLAYALQWWIFGGFAVALWARLVRDEVRAATEDDDEDAPGEDAPEDDDAPQDDDGDAPEHDVSEQAVPADGGASGR